MGILSKDPFHLESPREQRQHELDYEGALDSLMTRRLEDAAWLKDAFQGGELATGLEQLGVAVVNAKLSWVDAILTWRRLVAKHVEDSIAADDIVEEAQAIREGRRG